MSRTNPPEHVVIVDDDPRLCELLAEYLELHDHACDWLNDGNQLLAWLRLNPDCDAVVLDIDMPAIDGLSLLPTLRAAHPDLPVLMCTGAGFDERKMAAARAAGASGYVSKGLPVADTYVALRRVVAQEAKRREEAALRAK